MLKRIKTNKRKGFTLIELIVVMAVLAVLVLLAAPKFLGHTKEATFTKHINNAKVLEDASERYYIDHGKWPRGEEEPYTPEEVEAYAERIFDITGEELTLDEGKYWDIDYNALAKYAKLPDEDERANYVLRNPVGKVFYLEGLTEKGKERTGFATPSETEKNENKTGVIATQEYIDNDQDIIFNELDSVVFDGNVNSSQAIVETVTWQGNIADREISISGRGHLVGYSNYPLHVEFLNSNNEVVRAVGSKEDSTLIASSENIRTVKVTVPAEAVKMRFFSATGNYTSHMRISEIEVPQVKERTMNHTLTSTSTFSSVTLSWSGSVRTHIYKNGVLLASTTGTTFTDTPMHSDEEQIYNVIFMDKNGNGQAVTYCTYTAKNLVKFGGMGPAAFDGNLKTHHAGLSNVTWEGDLSNQKITIAGRGYGVGYSSYKLMMQFLDMHGNPVPAVGSKNHDNLIASNSLRTISLIVPKEATQMRFYSENGSYESSMQVTDIMIVTE